MSMKSLKQFVYSLCLTLGWAISAHAEINNIQEIDPWEGMNRGVFAFNEGFDRYFFRPVAVGYETIMPKPLNLGISNFLGTTFEANTMLNSLLQAKSKNFGLSLARFSINLTLGFFGLFDVATELGVTADKEDFGQTFAAWGMPQGPYIVLPFLGPSTVRDGVGLYPDILVNPLITDNVRVRNTSFAVFLVDKRAELLESEKLITGDKYIFLRDAYLQHRTVLINDGAVEDTFGDEVEEGDDWLDDEF